MNFKCVQTAECVLTFARLHAIAVFMSGSVYQDRRLTLAHAGDTSVGHYRVAIVNHSDEFLKESKEIASITQDKKVSVLVWFRC